MKRQNVQDAFVGEGNPHQEGVRVAATGDEAIELNVVRGHVMVVVPAGVPDEQLFEKQERILGELHLENGTILSFSIEDGASGAYVGTTQADNSKETAHHDGLNSLNVPSAS